MLADLDLRRALLVVGPGIRTSLLRLFGQGRLQNWTALAPDNLERARSLHQLQPYDVLLIDEAVYQGKHLEALAWVKQQPEIGVLLVSRTEPARVSHALANGVQQWLPRALALEHPLMLAAALEQVAGLCDLRKRSRQVGAALQESRRQVERLAGLLWRTLPTDGQPRWLTQRHLMERFQEEVSRAGRYGDPLTVVLGEVESPSGTEEQPFGPWLVDRLTRAKRRCDVAGQYGPRGFLLLLVHTPEAGGVACCQRLRQVLRQPKGPPEKARGPLQADFGLASFSATASTCAGLLSLAEKNLANTRAAGQKLLVV